jgi:hypothetical protein
LLLGAIAGSIYAALKSSSSSGSGTLPLVKPPVASSVPVGLKDGSASLSSIRTRLSTLDPQHVRDRFFDPDGGPTNMFRILQGVDDRIAGINSRIKQQFACLNSTAPVNFTILQWDGTNVTMKAQCNDPWGSGEGFDMFALVNQTFYIYVFGGETAVAAQVQMDADGNATQVDVWYSVGLINLNGSHAVTRIRAIPANQTFEMTVAGAGIGFCGGQVRSSGGVVRIVGSEDMGTTCDATDSVCANSNNVTEVVNCTDAVNTFVLPPIGRLAYTGPNGAQGASDYPGGSSNHVQLQANGSDDTIFGPTASVL